MVSGQGVRHIRLTYVRDRTLSSSEEAEAYELTREEGELGDLPAFKPDRLLELLVDPQVFVHELVRLCASVDLEPGERRPCLG